MRKKLIFLLFACTIVSLESKKLLHSSLQEQLETFAQQWADSHRSLDPFALQLLGNFLYFSHQQTILNGRVCKQSTALIHVLKKTLHIAEGVAGYEKPKGTLTEFTHTMNQFKSAVKARYNAYLSWKHCNAYIKEHGNEDVQKALTQLQKLGEQVVVDYAAAHAQEITVSIKEMQDSFMTEQLNIEKSLNALNQALEALDSECNMLELITLDLALKNCMSVGENAWNMLNSTQALRLQQHDILAVSRELFFTFYRELYRCLEGCDEQYHMILFSPRGLLTKQEISDQLWP